MSLDGSENGQFLALDLGGTNFRVIKLQLEKGKIVDEIIEYYQVEETLRLGPGPNLFKFLAECIKDFLQKLNKVFSRIMLYFFMSLTNSK